MKNCIVTFQHDQSGAATVEKMVVIGCVIGLCIAAMTAITGNTKNLTSDARTAMVLSQLNVENGRFEIEGVRPNTMVRVTEIDGWHSSGGNFEVWGSGFIGLEAKDGDTFIELNNTIEHLDTISTSMDIPDGEEVYLVFDSTARRDDPNSERFGIRVNGEIVATIIPDTVKDWRTHTVPITGGPGEDLIEIFEYSSDGHGVMLDNIYVAQM